MQHLHMLPPQERIRQWRYFRNGFTFDQTDLEQIEMATVFWETWPITKFYLEPEEPHTWITPWEIIVENHICNVGRALLIEQTLLLSDPRWTVDRFNLIYFKCEDKSDMFMGLLIDNKYLSNYTYGTIEDFDTVRGYCVVLNKYAVNSRFEHTII